MSFPPNILLLLLAGFSARAWSGAAFSGHTSRCESGTQGKLCHGWLLWRRLIGRKRMTAHTLLGIEAKQLCGETSWRNWEVRPKLKALHSSPVQIFSAQAHVDCKSNTLFTQTITFRVTRWKKNAATSDRESQKSRVTGSRRIKIKWCFSIVPFHTIHISWLQPKSTICLHILEKRLHLLGLHRFCLFTKGKNVGTAHLERKGSWLDHSRTADLPADGVRHSSGRHLSLKLIRM